MRYGYHTFWEVNKDKGVQGAPAAMVHDLFFYEDGECEWFAHDIFAGEHARQPCGTVRIAENIYQVSWLEPGTRQVVTQVINLNTWTINSSFHFNSGKGLALTYYAHRDKMKVVGRELDAEKLNRQAVRLAGEGITAPGFSRSITKLFSLIDIPPNSHDQVSAHPDSM